MPFIDKRNPAPLRCRIEDKKKYFGKKILYKEFNDSNETYEVLKEQSPLQIKILYLFI